MTNPLLNFGAGKLESMFEGMLEQIPKSFCLVGKTYIPLSAIVWYNCTTHKLILDKSRLTLIEGYDFFEAWLNKLSHQMEQENSASMDIVPKTFVRVDNVFIHLAKINYIVDESIDGVSNQVSIFYQKDNYELHGKAARDFIHFMDSRMADVDWEDE